MPALMKRIDDSTSPIPSAFCTDRISPKTSAPITVAETISISATTVMVVGSRYLAAQASRYKGMNDATIPRPRM